MSLVDYIAEGFYMLPVRWLLHHWQQDQQKDSSEPLRPEKQMPKGRAIQVQNEMSSVSQMVGQILLSHPQTYK